MKLTEIYREAMESFAKEQSFPPICAGTGKSSAGSTLLIGPGSLQPSPKMPLSSVEAVERAFRKAAEPPETIPCGEVTNTAFWTFRRNQMITDLLFDVMNSFSTAKLEENPQPTIK